MEFDGVLQLRNVLVGIENKAIHILISVVCACSKQFKSQGELIIRHGSRRKKDKVCDVSFQVVHMDTPDQF